MDSSVARECRRCIMSTVADRDIEFDENGVCNHCQRYDALVSTRVIPGHEGQVALAKIVEKIKRHGKGNEYDCLIGVSGGVDSTYVAYLTKSLGLKPLAVHVDNGWNSELAVKNIERTMHNLGIDLHTEVLDWTEFRDLQLSFLKASTSDMDIPADHAIQATLWQQALKHNIRYIISGMNFATESTAVRSWAYGHWDWAYIKGIQDKFGTKKLKTFPHYTYFYLLYANFIRKVRSISILNYMDYDKDSVMTLIQEKFGWKYYGGKHYESIFTRFIQGYILPVKFGVDKRYGHLSDLVRHGTLTREQALEKISEPPYPEDVFSRDRTFFIKKFNMTEADFQEIMNAPVKSYKDYRNTEWVEKILRRGLFIARKLRVYPL